MQTADITQATKIYFRWGWQVITMSKGVLVSSTDNPTVQCSAVQRAALPHVHQLVGAHDGLGRVHPSLGQRATASLFALKLCCILLLLKMNTVPPSQFISSAKKIFWPKCRAFNALSLAIWLVYRREGVTTVTYFEAFDRIELLVRVYNLSQFLQSH